MRYKLLGRTGLRSLYTIGYRLLLLITIQLKLQQLFFFICCPVDVFYYAFLSLVTGIGMLMHTSRMRVAAININEAVAVSVLVDVFFPRWFKVLFLVMDFSLVSN